MDQKKDENLILPWILKEYTSTGCTSMGHISMKLKKSKLLTGPACVLRENYKYPQKQHLEVIFFL